MTDSKGKSSGISRRSALQLGAGGLAAGSMLSMPSLVYGQTEAIKIGHLTPMTGFLGSLGEWAVKGIQLAAEEINAAGGVMGRPLDVSSEDSINPDTAATKAQRMLERDGNAFLMGEISSASALAISQVAARNKRLFMALGPRSDTLRGKSCNRYMFCTDIPNTVMVNAVGSALLREGMVEGKKFVTLTADYVFGHDLLTAAKAFFDRNGATLVQDDLVATDVTDFSPYLIKIRQAQPDVVCLNLAGNQVTNFVKQYSEYGLPFPTVGFNLNTADAWAAGDGNLTGTWPTVWYHTLDNPDSKGFVERFQAKYGELPENHAWIEYIALKIAAQAMEETGSTDSEKLVDYFESGAKFNILKDREAYFRSWDHQLIQEAYPFTVKAPGEAADQFDILRLGEAVPGAEQDLEVIYPTSDQNPCKL
ncbi:ABC transporter substrate-binding protein [Roseibium sp. CAU 1637]|uniref:ABC transporter substrate-binding protein n=1 Tax=Roseibium limicola TaxID=2816037 RepID=A0A939J8F5_9HYPH|nr:ABC transporter substrate-binding protein [Roseibium limicola]MBO0344303.1 ABC transporter substrate-binding protein [Roseibium limicola]